MKIETMEDFDNWFLDIEWRFKEAKITREQKLKGMMNMCHYPETEDLKAIYHAQDLIRGVMDGKIPELEVFHKNVVCENLMSYFESLLIEAADNLILWQMAELETSDEEDK